MNQVAIPGFYSEAWYNEKNVTEYGYILYENRLLGAIQLRQKKVRNNSCLVADDFKQEIRFCYNSYAPAFEDKLAFGPCENIDNETCDKKGYASVFSSNQRNSSCLDFNIHHRIHGLD